MPETKEELLKRMSDIGKLGGVTKGKTKRRGDSEYYRRINAMRKKRSGGRPKKTLSEPQGSPSEHLNQSKGD